MELARTGTESEDGIGRKLKLAEMYIKAVVEELSMRAQYYHEITEQGVEAARQMTFLVE